MKKCKPVFFALTLVGLLIASSLASCFKDFKEDYLFTDFMVEFEAATRLSFAPGKTYPVLGPVEKGSGILTYQVNLLGSQKETEQRVKVQVVTEESTAEEGVHFRLMNDGVVTIGANQSNGLLSLEILDFPAESGTDTLVLELVEGDGVKVSENYKRLGLAISLTGPPSELYSLYSQLGGDNYYNSIYIDPQNLNLSVDVQQRLTQCAENLAAYADGSRSLQGVYLYFGQDELVNVVAQYYGGGGNSLTAGPAATWTYKMELDNQGAGYLVFQEANANGNAQKDNFAPLLANYLEKYKFRIDWVPNSIASSPEGRQIGGLFREDDGASFMFGTLETLNASGSIRAIPYANSLYEIFRKSNGGFYSTVLIDPESEFQSNDFRSRWAAARTNLVNQSGRKLYRMMFYFNPDFNFQDLRVVIYYYTASDGKFIGQVRCQFQVSSEGILLPLKFIYQDGNGGAVRRPELIDDFLMKMSFKMTREGSNVRFVSTTDPNAYFVGALSDHPVGAAEFWP